eukprot:766174-Hanusia_phi.AAC.5
MVIVADGSKADGKVLERASVGTRSAIFGRGGGKNEVAGQEKSSITLKRELSATRFFARVMSLLEGLKLFLVPCDLDGCQVEVSVRRGRGSASLL